MSLISSKRRLVVILVLILLKNRHQEVYIVEVTVVAGRLQVKMKLEQIFKQICDLQ